MHVSLDSPFIGVALNILVIPSEARFLLGLIRDRMASAHTFRVASKRLFSLARQRELGSIAGPQVGKHGWLSSREH